MTSEYCLVTGAAGFIGSRLTEALLLRGRSVIALDSFLDELYPASVKKHRWKRLQELGAKQLKLFEFDLRKDDFGLFDSFKVECIYNQAALPGLINDSRIYPLYYECNISALNRLLEFAKSREIRKFIQASTSSVYGRSAIGDESSDLRPISPYGVSKLAAEKLILAYQESCNIEPVILRYFSVYGPGQRPDMAYSKLIKAALSGGEFQIHGDGLQKRSNTYIDDVVDATIRAAEVSTNEALFNVCGDETISLLDAISQIESIIGVKIRIKQTDSRSGDQRETSGKNEKIKTLLNWSAQTNFKTGIEMQIASANLN